MFDRVLIANRGEVVVRIQRACRSLGLRTLVVHSQADAGYDYVRQADAAVCIGPPASRFSYLDGAAILLAAETLGAQAVHPGYGFLAENADFARDVAQAGMVFVGPNEQCIARMGDKIAAKQAMRAAGVPCVPGSDGALKPDDPRVAEIARDIGYPVLVKAAGGGGGRGMRVVYEPSDLRPSIRTTREEAFQAFGNAEVYLEKYLARPRHVEIQILCDRHGNGVWLGSRDCSMQRRHQKVVEEAPAPGIAADQLARIGSACLKACREIGYEGAGTFEFMVEDGEFYFIEMNTRLQVEHGITELIYGVDIVQWQLRIARGEPLTLRQDALVCSGHAVECRINAENPATFAPTPGSIAHWSLPASGPDCRIDTHLKQGDAISPYYDSMIAKIMCHGATRAQAMTAMARAVDDMRVSGVSTTLPLHASILRDPAFLEAPQDVHYLEANLPRLMAGEARA
ncbi:acetyl-CoA carboxylase biotin carboxylase subunit [Bordetella genomosp. 10]|uniref:Acetyl-CoA carboxylase biotin carboxylase subunit n=1 Tax=Bordetella genomosp. 10 TaxID=1416804 RepID=A0A261S2K7_9BORD|nr:acetyl-CoA carboxylase biotin carboxylase subunit [Bordetella genomosp. 10]OZI31579.1 acetyl-CoA carboxylase biotin carboxylase subunit [Bordetella genomosp. 10]